MSPAHPTRTAQAAAWFRDLRDQICTEFEALETELIEGTHAHMPAGRFERNVWNRDAEEVAEKQTAGEAYTGGGGEISMMKGRVFEKVGVNISVVHGVFSEQFRREIPGAEHKPHYWAAGISLVAHMHSPLVPAVHMNTRMIMLCDRPIDEASEPESPILWFGGGADLNPMFPDATDTADFHAALQAPCDAMSADWYPAFKRWCDEYFFIPHRGEARGVGGIFYDYLGFNALSNTSVSTKDMPRFGKGGESKELTRAGMELAMRADYDWDALFNYTKQIGLSFNEIFPALVRRHMHKSWTQEQRAHQLKRRGLYAEYNLLYDRGTRFGLMTGGNPDAILMSLPPVATWE